MELDVALMQLASTLVPADNRAALARAPRDADLVVFPEAFAREFGDPRDETSDLSGAAESVDGPFAQALAGLGPIAVAGMFETSGDPQRPFNTLVVRPGDAAYRKVHLYDSFGYKESDRLSAGDLQPVVVDVEGWQVGLLTCYDLRFPEWSRRLVDAGAEVLVAPSAWVAGDRKVDHWRTLVKARAIENTAYVVAVGQPGPRYTGHSMVVDPLGDVLVEAGEGEEILRATLHHDVLEEARRTNPSLANRRL